ncbi:Rho GTPase-activating protein 6 [Trichinella sp. T6]|nr:Rho GTPase-activating protein 6 [Trichinella sp. T6]
MTEKKSTDPNFAKDLTAESNEHGSSPCTEQSQAIVSPFILRRTHWKLHQYFKRLSDSSREFYERGRSTSGESSSYFYDLTESKIGHSFGSTSSSLCMMRDSTESPLSSTTEKSPGQESKTCPIDKSAVWSPTSNCMWRNALGEQVELKDRELHLLTILERKTLQKLAVRKLKIPDFQDTVFISGKERSTPRSKKLTISYWIQSQDRKSNRFKETGSADSLGVAKPRSIFGLSFPKYAENDIASPSSGRPTASAFKPSFIGGRKAIQNFRMTHSVDVADVQHCLNRTSVSAGSLNNNSQKKSVDCDKSLLSLDSRYLNERISPLSDTAEKRLEINDPLNQKKSLISRVIAVPSRQDSCETYTIELPRVIRFCVDYLRNYGMDKVGLFRVSGSSNRCRWLKQQLEMGTMEGTGTSNTETLPITAHDVATVLKNYLRDLQDPLLTKELYLAFVTTASQQQQYENYIENLRYLIALLPPKNSAILEYILEFLSSVAENAEPVIDEANDASSAGNKMNAKNIATVFGPSLLRPDMTKQKPSLAHNEAVIAVVEALILHHRQLFTVTKETQDEVFRLLLETDPDSLDTLLYRRLQEYSTTEENE